MSALTPTGLSRRGKDLLDGFTPGQKAVTVLAIAGMVLGGFLFFSWASKPDYVPLFSNLPATDAASITQKLTANHVPYQLTDGGATVLVPSKSVYQERLAMASAGLPTGGTSGYSLLDKTSITTSDFQQHVDYQRALEGELTKTIDAMDGIDAAVVHLVIPNEDLFSQDSQKPSASVLVKTAPGTTLSAEQVQSIVHLVSSSVAGLTPDAVTVADSQGNLLSAPGMDGMAAAAGDARSERTAAFDNATAQNIQQMLEQVVGAGHAVVRVSADLNFDSQTSTSTTYTKGPASSQSTTSESFKGPGSPSTGGTLGTGTLPTINGGGTGNNTYSQSTTTQDNSNNTTTTQTTKAPGSVQQMHVAVLLDQKTAANVNTGQITSLVNQAAGVVPSRGDTVTVAQMPFDASAAKAQAKELAKVESSKKMAGYISMAKTALIVLFILALLFLAFRSAKKRADVVFPATDRLELEEAKRALASLQQPREIEQRGEPRELVPAPRVDPSVNEAKRALVRDEIGELVERQPEEVAQLLRGWLADRRN